MYFDEPAESFVPMPGTLKAVLGVSRPVQSPVLRLSGARWSQPRRRRRSRCSRCSSTPTAHGGRRASIAHDAIGSTNAEALTRARAGERGPLWITARRQTAGPRPARPQLGVGAGQSLRQPAADRSVAAGALRRAVVRRGGSRCTTLSRGRIPGLSARLGLKWPNDLLLDRSEVRRHPDRRRSRAGAVVVGIGVNCVHHPAGTEFPATDLATAGVRITPESAVRPALGRDGVAAGAVEPRRGLCRHPRRLARPRRRARQDHPRARSLTATFQADSRPRRHRPADGAHRRRQAAPGRGR